MFIKPTLYISSSSSSFSLILSTSPVFILSLGQLLLIFTSIRTIALFSMPNSSKESFILTLSSLSL